MRLHIDTDFGGDPDDACALAMLLGRLDVDIVGITTNLEADGQRAGCVAHYLELAGRTDIPVAAGADASMTTGRRYRPTWGDRRYWPDPIAAKPGPPPAAVDLLRASIDDGATIVAIGAFTNLARLELDRPGSLTGVPVVATAGWLQPPPPEFPQWGAAMDWNVQCDTRAVEIVAASADLTLVALPAAMRAQLRERDLPRLRSSGRIGALLARQSASYAVDSGMPALARAHSGIAADLVNFHWDPVTGAVATGWDGATVVPQRLTTSVVDGILTFREAPDGRPAGVVVGLDGPAFAEVFLEAVERADAGARPR